MEARCYSSKKLKNYPRALWISSSLLLLLLWPLTSYMTWSKWPYFISSHNKEAISYKIQEEKIHAKCSEVNIHVFVSSLLYRKYPNCLKLAKFLSFKILFASFILKKSRVFTSFWPFNCYLRLFKFLHSYRFLHYLFQLSIFILYLSVIICILCNTFCLPRTNLLLHLYKHVLLIKLFGSRYF